MTACLLSALCLLLAVTSGNTAHQVSFLGGRTLPAAARQEMQRDLRAQSGVQSAPRSIQQFLEEANRKLGVDIDSLQEVERSGVVKGGLHGSREHPVTRAAALVRRTVEQKLDRNRKEADMVRQVRALINELEVRSQAQTKEAELLGDRAVNDLQSALTVERRAELVRDMLEHNQQQRTLNKAAEIKRSTAQVGSAEEAVKRGMNSIKDITEQLQHREAEKREIARREAFEELKQLASRSLKEKVMTLSERNLETELKRGLASSDIVWGLSKIKRALEAQKSEKARTLTGMNIANDIAQTKRTLETRESEKASDILGMKVAADVAAAKRTLERRTYEEARELTKTRATTQLAQLRRAIDEHKLHERQMAEERFSKELETLKRAVDELKAGRALDTLETYRRTMESHDGQQVARRAMQGLKASVEDHVAKRDAELSELQALFAGDEVDATELKVTA